MKKVFKYRLIDMINPRKWWSVFVAYILKHHCASVAPHIVAQYAVRFFDDECRGCVASGNCAHCGCDMPSKALNDFESCSAGNWGPIMDADQWDAHVKKVGLDIKIVYARTVPAIQTK